MARIRRGLFAAACAVLGGTLFQPGTAQARVGEAECLWQHLPSQMRQAAFAAYDRSGKEGLYTLPMDNAVIDSALRACGTGSVKDEDVAKIGASLMGATLQHTAARFLAAGGVTETRLSDAWRRTSAADRKIIRDGVTLVSPADAENSRALFGAMARAIARAGGRAPSNWPQVKNRKFEAYLDYFQGRAQREEYERLY